jgi:hypothetical protein
VLERRTTLTVDYQLDVAYFTTRMRHSYKTSWSLHNVITDAFAATSGFNEVNELGYLLVQSVGVVSGDEYQHVILDSVGDGMHVFWLRRRVRRTLRNCG